jgi:hypothetical protein
MAINKNRKVLLARSEPRIEMQQHDWGRGSGDDSALCPVQYGWQRAAHAHTILSAFAPWKCPAIPPCASSIG